MQMAVINGRIFLSHKCWQANEYMRKHHCGQSQEAAMSMKDINISFPGLLLAKPWKVGEAMQFEQACQGEKRLEECFRWAAGATERRLSRATRVGAAMKL